MLDDISPLTIWPSTNQFHSSHPDWIPSQDCFALLDFTAELVVDVARTNSAVTQERVAYWLAEVALGPR